MATKIIQDERIQHLNNKESQKRDYVLYWMQRSQRAEDNHALEYAIQQANDLKQPLLVVFGLTDDYPEANLRHFTFMLEGLQETRKALADRRGIKMVIRRGNPAEVALEVGRQASLIVCDRGYLREPKAWRRKVAAEAECRVTQVESDVIVPVEVVSNKSEYAARTIRPKIHKHLDDYLVELRTTPLDRDSLDLKVAGMDLSDVAAAVDRLDIDRSVGPVSHFFRGGTAEAKKLLRSFLEEKLDRYADHRNQPQTNDVSHMSKYLHFGQISPLYLVLQVQEAKGKPAKDKETFVEEVVVRRDLAINFVNYNEDIYDSFSCLPNWARETLMDHRGDEREHRYTRQEMEDAHTHDPYWNAAMKEMRYTGYMHNYMRMYWGKKILEWCNTPEYAYQTTLAINNKFFLDGRDPNSFANVGWIFGLHDRGWPERPVFGKVRYMSAGGLERKTDIKAYVEKVEALVE